MSEQSDVNEASHVAYQAAARIRHVKAGHTAIVSFVHGSGKRDGVVCCTVAYVRHVVPQHACIDANDDPASASNQVGDTALVVTRDDAVSDLVAVQNRLLPRDIAAAQLPRGQVWIVDSPVVADGEIDHLTLRRREA